MRTGSSFLTILLAALALGLIGCEGSNPAPAQTPADAQGETAGNGEADRKERISMSETAWLTVSSEGFVHTTFIDADGSYRDYRQGTLLFTGDWRENPEGELCFSPEEGAGECWSFTRPEKDGTMRIRDGDGREIMLKRITYTPPADTEEDNPVDAR